MTALTITKWVAIVALLPEGVGLIRRSYVRNSITTERTRLKAITEEMK